MKRNHIIVYVFFVCSIILLYQITFIDALLLTKSRTQKKYNLQQQQQQQFTTSTNSRYNHHHIVHTTTTSSPILCQPYYMTTTVTTRRTRRSSNHVLYSSSSNNNNKDNKQVDTTTTVDNDDTTTSSTSMMSNTNIDNLDPDPSMLLSSYNDTIQQIGFISIIILLTFGTYTCINILSFIENYIVPHELWYSTIWHNYILSIPISILFIIGGSTHFILKDIYIPMIPPKNTWGGLWPKLPTPYIDQIPIIKQQQLSYEEYHVYWTGIAEISGGLLLLLASITQIIPIYIPSFLLFILLICITPANIYMATHNIQLPNDNVPPISYPYGHINRGIIQCILLAMLYQLTFT